LGETRDDARKGKFVGDFRRRGIERVGGFGDRQRLVVAIVNSAAVGIELDDFVELVLGFQFVKLMFDYLQIKKANIEKNKNEGDAGHDKPEADF
jgi:hypothetical protein